MGALARISDRVLRRAAAATLDQTPAQRVGEPVDARFPLDAFLGAATSASITVTVPKSLGHTAVFACVRLLSDGVGQLPLKVFQRLTGGGRVEAWSTPAYRLLHDEPNPEMAPVDLWSMVTAHMTTYGNAYVAKQRGTFGVSALWPIHPELVRVKRDRGRKLFDVRPSPAMPERTYSTDDVLHFRGLSLDGLRGVSVVEAAKEAIAAGLALDAYTHRFFANDATPGGILSVQGTLDEAAQTRIRRAWEAMHRGVRNVRRVAVLEGGAEFKSISSPLRDAQFVEQAELNVQEIARAFNVPVSMIQGTKGDSLTYSTVEKDSIHFVRYSLTPWLRRIEQTLGRDRELFPLSPNGGVPWYPQFLVDALLRADAKTRAEVYTKALDPDHGWMRRDEVRTLEDLGPEKTTPAAADTTEGA